MISMRTFNINEILSAWSIYVQILVEIPLFIIMFLGWITTKKRVMSLWTIAWLLNLTALGILLLSTKRIDNTLIFVINQISYELYGILKISFSILLLFSAFQYSKCDKIIKFPFYYYFLGIIVLFLLFLNINSIEIQFFVYLFVSIFLLFGSFITFRRIKSKDGKILSFGFLIEGSFFLHHSLILFSWFFSKHVPVFMSRISFYDTVSEFVLALSFLLAVIINTIEELQQTNLKLTNNQEILRSLIDYDPLTGLKNRRVLRKVIENLKGNEGVVAFLDIDKFKRINDNFGHPIGDKCLVEIAKELKKAFRADDELFRYGGDEFLIIVPDLSVEQVKKRLDDLRMKMENKKFGVKLGFSYGLSKFDKNKSFDSVLNEADKNMYKSKNNKDV